MIHINIIVKSLNRISYFNGAIDTINTILKHELLTFQDNYIAI